MKNFSLSPPIQQMVTPKDDEDSDEDSNAEMKTTVGDLFDDPVAFILQNERGMNRPELKCRSVGYEGLPCSFKNLYHELTKCNKRDYHANWISLIESKQVQEGGKMVYKNRIGRLVLKGQRLLIQEETSGAQPEKESEEVPGTPPATEESEKVPVTPSAPFIKPHVSAAEVTHVVALTKPLIKCTMYEAGACQRSMSDVSAAELECRCYKA